jgi:transposase-like protein
MERIRKQYSMAFKQKIMEEIRDGKWKSAYQAATMYGIKDALVYKWMDKLGYSHLKSKVIEVKTMEEIDEVKMLRKQVRELKLALAEETLSRQIEQATVQVAAGIIGISTEELKKKAGTQSRI